MVNTVPQEHLGGIFNGRKYNHICKEQKYNFIDHCFPTYGNIKGCLNYDKIDYHRGITHLNSSQAMCINYFKKFFETEKYESLLAEILLMHGIDTSGCKGFSDAVFFACAIPISVSAPSKWP